MRVFRSAVFEFPVLGWSLSNFDWRQFHWPAVFLRFQKSINNSQVGEAFAAIRFRFGVIQYGVREIDELRADLKTKEPRRRGYASLEAGVGEDEELLAASTAESRSSGILDFTTKPKTPD